MTGIAKLERKLYVIRKRAGRAMRASDIRDMDFFYVRPLSCRTIVYKRSAAGAQIQKFFKKDLADPDCVSACWRMVHQRFPPFTFPTWPLASDSRYICHNGGDQAPCAGTRTGWRRGEAVMASDVWGDDLKKSSRSSNRAAAVRRRWTMRWSCCTCPAAAFRMSCRC